MVGDVIRWWYRLIMVPWSEWHKARIDLAAQEAIHLRKVRTGAEVEKLRISLANLSRMHQEAARALDRNPASAPLIVELLRQQEFELRRVASGISPVGEMDEAAD